MTEVAVEVDLVKTSLAGVTRTMSKTATSMMRTPSSKNAKGDGGKLVGVHSLVGLPIAFEDS